MYRLICHIIGIENNKGQITHPRLYILRCVNGHKRVKLVHDKWEMWKIPRDFFYTSLCNGDSI